jgi:DNA ligase-1
MNAPWTILAEITANDSKLAKQAILEREAKAGNDNFFKGLLLACNQVITFGVKAVEEKPAKRANEPAPKGLSHDVFFKLTDKLAKREITGDAAQVAIAHARNMATAEEWNGWFRLVLIKDLKAGFSESTINKVCETKYPQYSVPLFECQLAHDGANYEEKLVGKKLVDTKLDGMRVLTIVYPDGKVDQFSRNGKELVNFVKVKEQLSKVAKFFAEPTVLDGEIMSASFQDLMKQARRKTDVQADDAVLNLFDILTLKEFQAGISAHRQIDRSYSLGIWFENVKDKVPNVNVLGQEMVDLDTAAGQARLDEINAVALAGKYEGIMLKDPEALYECKRSVAWLKIKPYIEVTLKVVDVEEGSADSKFVGTMGAVVFEGEDDGKFINVHCGGGFSVKQRAQIWATHTGKPVSWKKKEGGKWVTIVEQPNKGGMIGMLGEVRADAITKSDSKDHYSLRFPRFKIWRGFAPGEKL